jgi:hypothetical protein
LTPPQEGLTLLVEIVAVVLITPVKTGVPSTQVTVSPVIYTGGNSKCRFWIASRKQSKEKNMRRVIGFLALSIAVGISATAALADVIVSTSLSLTELQISTSSGSVVLVSPFSASANVFALDDLSGVNSNFNQVNDTATSVTAATAFASAAGAASSTSDLVSSLAASASSGVNIPGTTTSFAESTGQGGLGSDLGGTGLFEIVSPSDTTISVTFSATLSGDQTLTTDADGEFATSEIVFSLLLPDISGTPIIFIDNPLCIGTPPGSTCISSSPSTLNSPYSNTLTDTVQLQTNTDYTLIAEADAESSGLNVPEPSSIFLTAWVSFAVLFAGRTWRNRTNARKKA